MTSNSQQFFNDPSVSGSNSPTVWATRKRHIFFLLSVLVYIVSFIIMYKWKNFGMGAVAIIPVITAACFYGAAAGGAAGLLSLAANMIMGQILGIDWYMRIIKTGAGIEGTVGFIAIGVIIGRISDLSRRLKKELSEKERIEHELELHRQSLEKKVEEKTLELSVALMDKTASNKELANSEKRLRAVFETAIDAIVTTNSTGEIASWNKAAEIMYGYNAAEVLGRHFNMLIPERLYDSNNKGMSDALRQCEDDTVYNRIEGTGLRKDGSEFPTEVSQSVWKSGDEVLATGIIRDITERKRSEQALLEREARFRSVVETAVDAIITVNSTGAIIDWNQAAEKIYGYTVAEIIGIPAQILIPQRIHALDSKQMRDAVEQGKEHLVYNRREGIGIRKDGSEFPTEVSQSVWKSGNEVFATGIVRDITERKNAEKVLLEREERLRSIVETAVDAIITTDSHGTIVFWNNAAENIFGYAEQEIVGKNAIMLLPERLHGGLDALRDAFFYQGVQKGRESIGLKKDGTEFPIEVSRALWDSEGATFITAIVRDITERKNVERDRLLLSSALEQAEENIMIMDPQGIILYVNPAVGRQAKLPAEELIGTNGFQPIDSWYDSQFFTDIYAQLLKGGTWTGVLNYKIGDGKTAFIQQELSPVLDAEGRVINILSISRDVTHEQTLEEQLRQSQKMEAIGTLAGGIAHDFNNILAAILGYTELAMMDLPKEGIPAERLRYVISSCDRARSLVKQILAFSRRSLQDPCPVKINTIIKEALKLLRASLPSTIRIQQDIRAADAVVMADPTQLHQLIINLCTNAAQAMEDSGGILTVGLHDCLLDTNDMAGCYDLAPGSYVRLIVGDTGTGIAPEIKERIFEPFFTTKEVGKGTGMGLAVAHGIVKSYGGCISADNKPDTGAAFSVLLPRIDGGLMTPLVQQPVEIPHGTETLLYIDDEEPVLYIGRDMLESLGYAVVSTCSSQQALEIFSAEPGRFACVITDMTMPNIRGDELASKLLELRPGLPIILCTGFSEKISEEKALQLGIQAFLLKPFTMQELGAAVRKVIDARE